ncbi:MAG TPA: nucleotidyltransferase domain-containing protein [Blastocatellia bacterium]|nr:nucleotidyltransferase domain-containing protein [Blastocatellia bacterium]
MKTFSLAPGERDMVRSVIREALAEEQAVVFAYLYGSFIASGGFNDIDVALWVDEAQMEDEGERFEYQLDLTVRIERYVRPFPVDLVLLNAAPLPLRFRVVSEGEFLVSKVEAKRIEFEERTRMLSFDFLPHLDVYYEKIVPGR